MTETQKSNQKLAQTYDEFNYTSNVFLSSQPSHLHALAKMKGLNPTPVETAKVLEIGCSFGGNILPFAIRFPKSEVVGIDLSEKQIEVGQQIINLVGINNISLLAGDISQIKFEQKFDYIICHGVFSWVPEFVRQAILACVQNYLSPNGVAYISYNTYPGWKGKDIVKDLMLFGSNRELPVSTRIDQAIELLKFTDNVLDNSSIHQYMKEMFSELKSHSKYYLAHEQFEEYNHPMYFKEFVENLNKYDLAYVTDSSKPAILPQFIFKGEQYKQVCDYFNNQLETIEQYIDFIQNRTFRMSVITHKQNLVNHNITNNVEAYGNCHHFYDLYFGRRVNFVESKGDQKAYWEDLNGMRFSDIPLNKILFEYLAKQPGLIKIGDIFNALKDKPEYDEANLKELIWLLVHLNGTILSFSPVTLKKAGRKPHIPQAMRNFLQVILANPNITSYSNIVFELVSLSVPTVSFSQYFDGTRTMKELVQLFRLYLQNGAFHLNDQNNQPIPSEQVTDSQIKGAINNIINELEIHGFFNHF